MKKADRKALRIARRIANRAGRESNLVYWPANSTAVAVRQPEVIHTRPIERKKSPIGFFGEIFRLFGFR
jgi:hypothetical protein